MSVKILRNGPARHCAYCTERVTRVCDFTITANGDTCSAPMCTLHAWRPKIIEDRDYCRTHRRRMEEHKQRAKAALERRTIPGLVFFSSSRYPGKCADTDCGAVWKKGWPCWWDPVTKKVYCDDCGPLLAETDGAVRSASNQDQEFWWERDAG